MEKEQLKNYIYGDIDDIIQALEETKEKIKECNDIKTLEEYDDIIHKKIYSEVDILNYVED